MEDVLIQFVDGPYNNHRLSELNSILVLIGLKPAEVYSVPKENTSDNSDNFSPKIRSPFLLARLTVQQAKRICERAILIRRIISVWTHGPTVEIASRVANQVSPQHKHILQYNEYLLSKPNRFELEQELLPKKWKLSIDSYGERRTAVERAQFRAAVMNFKSRPKGKPERSDFSASESSKFILLEDRLTHSITSKLFSSTQDSMMDKCGESTVHAVEALSYFFFGWELAVGQRSLLGKYDLKKRPFIGPTSTCAELAFIMTNQALAQKGKSNADHLCVWQILHTIDVVCKIYILNNVIEGSFVIDSFVGTGSLLVAAVSCLFPQI